MLLDLGLPDGSGYELCKEIRAAGDTLIIILSARDEEASIVLGLDLGADDYLTKPFRLRGLISRMKAVLRRRGPVDFRPPQTGYRYFRTWTRQGIWQQITERLVRQVRQRVGRDPQPSAAVYQG